MSNVKRSKTAHHQTLSQWNGNRKVHWEAPPNGSSVLEVQTTTDATVFKDVPASENHLTPPYHWHWHQKEYFEIQSGRFMFKYAGTTMTKSASDGKVTIPPGVRHTFWPDPTCTEPCTVHIGTEEGYSNGVDEKFFRNLYSYLEDCAEQKIAPSLPQLLLFLDAAETSLALPDWIPGVLSRWFTWGLGVVVGRWFGGKVLGLKDSYEEYYEERKRR